MTGTLIRRHPLVRELPKTALASLVTAGLGSNVLGFAVAYAARTGREPAPGFVLPLLEVLVVLSLSGLVLKGSPGVRCREWEASLPETARRLWSAHWGAASVAASVLVAVTAALVLGMVAFLLRRADVASPGAFALARVALEPLLVGLALAALLAAWRPACARPDRLPGWRPRSWAALGAASAVVVLAQPWPWVTPLLLAAAVAAALRAGRRLGPVLEWAGAADGQAHAPAGPVAWQAGPSRRTAWLAVGRQVSKWPMSLVLGLPMAGLFGLLLGGWTPSGDDEPAMRWSNVAMSAYILLAFSGHFLENLRRVDHLPISRRVLLAWLLAPGLGALAAGYGAARVWEALRPADPAAEVFAFDDGDDGVGLRIPPELWRLTTAAEAPVITAPWGESVTAQVAPLFRAGPLRLWKPYTAPPEASPRFAAWQLGRAVQEWYGLKEPAKAQTLAGACFAPGDGGRTRAVRADFSQALGLRSAKPVSGGPVFPVLMGGAVVLTLAAVGIYCAAFRAGATLMRTRVVFWTLMASLLALHLGGLVVLIGKAVEEWAVSGALFGGIRRLGGPGAAGWAAAWAVAAMAVAAAWRVAEASFTRVEALKEGGRGCR